jgi:hypothetical protein
MYLAPSQRSINREMKAAGVAEDDLLDEFGISSIVQSTYEFLLLCLYSICGICGSALRYMRLYGF